MKVFIEDFRTGETLKRCSKCGQYKKLDEYHKGGTSRGVSPDCKQCVNVPFKVNVFTEDPRTGELLKRCSKCKQYKKPQEYSRGRHRGLASRCRQCCCKPKQTLVDRFWKHYHSHTVRIGDCLEWTGAYATDGYPFYSWPNGTRRKQMRVGRLVYMLAIGDVPTDNVVMLSCNNRRCVRHAHLVLGTKVDREIKRRNSAAIGDAHGTRTKPGCLRSGSQHHNAKLTKEKVNVIRKMRANGIILSEIAQNVGVSISAVHNVVIGRTWKHVQ